MQLPTRPATVLSRPVDEVLQWTSQHAIDSEDEFRGNEQESPADWEFKLELCQQLSCWLGWAACAFASWQVICRRIAADQKDLVGFLNDNMFAEVETCRVAKVEAICLNGSLGEALKAQPEWSTGQGFLNRNFDHAGATTSSITANTDAASSRRYSRPPSLSEFRLEAKGRSVHDQMEKLRKDAEQRGNVYLVLLDQRYNCQQQSPPAGPLRWRSQTVLVRIEMQFCSLLAVQLAILSRAERLLIGGINLAGEEIARIDLAHQDRFADLRARFAEAMRQPGTDLRMVLPDGTLVAPEWDSKTIKEVLNSGCNRHGQNARQANALSSTFEAIGSR